MPIGPKGEKRPADVAANAVRVMQIATGEIVESEGSSAGKNPAAVALGRLGGEARAKKLSGRKLKNIARAAAAARWSKK